MDLKQRIRTVPNWPLEGIMFRDITTVLQDASAFAHTCDRLFERYENQRIDKVVGIDARGFIFGSVLAYRLGVGFVPVRKKGKLPADTIEVSYTLEYGENVVEIHTDALAPGERVVIVDDLIATGGTAAAAVSLVRQLAGEVVELAVVIELPDLGGRVLLGEVPVYVMTQFEGE